DAKCEQAGPAPAIPGAQEHCCDRKLIDRGTYRDGKHPADEESEAGQHEGTAIAMEHISHLRRQVPVWEQRVGSRFVLQAQALHDSPLACAANSRSDARLWR